MSPEPRTIRAFFEKQLADLRDSLPSVRAAAIVSEDTCLTVAADQLTPQSTQLNGFVAAARFAASALGLAQPRCLILDATSGVLIVRPIGTLKTRLLVIVLGDPRDVTRALAGVHRLAAEIESRLAPLGTIS